MKKTIYLFMLMALFSSYAYSADEWLKTRPQSTDARIDYPAAAQANNAALDRVLANYRQGMTLTYSSGSTIVVTAGEVVCSNSAGTVRRMRKNPSNTNVTFSDIDTGAEASSTTYYIYASCDADAETATFKISASSSAPTGITYYIRLGNFYNDSSSSISKIVNDNSTSYVGDMAVKSFNVTYQALTDLFIVATVTDSGNANPASVTLYSDTTSPPTTGIATAHGVDGWYGSASAIIRKGNYYKATATCPNSCLGSFNAIPMSN